jgi:hypothetical protein
VATITITGSAKDKISTVPPTSSGIIADVKYVLNNGSTQSMATLTQSAPGTYNFASDPEALTAGTNTLDIWAVDLAGNESLHAEFNFFYDLTNTLVLTIDGKGSVKSATDPSNVAAA